MPKADILFDKTEFVLRMADKQAMTMNIRADQITTITFQPTMQKKLFKKVPSEVMLIKTKGGAGGRLFGAVTSKEIAEELNRQYGLSVPKQKIVLEEPIKTFGVHRVKAKLYQDIAGEILVQVVEA